MRIPTDGLSDKDEFLVVKETLLALFRQKSETEKFFQATNFDRRRIQMASTFGADADNVLADAVNAAYEFLQEGSDAVVESSNEHFLSATLPEGFALPGLLNDMCIQIAPTGKSSKFKSLIVRDSAVDVAKFKEQVKSDVVYDLRTDHEQCSFAVRSVVNASFDTQTGIPELSFNFKGTTCSGKLEQLGRESCKGLYDSLVDLLNGHDAEVTQDLARFQVYPRHKIPQSLLKRCHDLATEWVAKLDLKCYQLRSSKQSTMVETIPCKYLRQSAMSASEIGDGAVQRGKDLKRVDPTIEDPVYTMTPSVQSGINDAQNRAREALVNELRTRYIDSAEDTSGIGPMLTQISDCLAESIAEIIHQLQETTEHGETELKAVLDVSIVGENEVPDWEQDLQSTEYIRIVTSSNGRSAIAHIPIGGSVASKGAMSTSRTVMSMSVDMTDIDGKSNV